MAGPLKGYQWPVSRNYDYITGTFEPVEVIDEFCSWFTPGTVFYDIGSNIGYYSFIANTIVVSGKIYAVEPTPFNNDLFKQLLQVNKKKLAVNNIELLAFAISDSEKEVEFSNNNIFAEGNTYVATAENFIGKKIKVQCYSIDGLLQKGYAAPDIIKMDIEGAEYDALVGAAATLQKYKPSILLATHNCIEPGISRKCVQYLEGLGYVLKHTGYQNKTMAGLDDYLAVHKEKIKPVNTHQTV